MNFIKKWTAQISDAFSREAVLRSFFGQYSNQCVNPVALAINAGGAVFAKHGGAAAAFLVVNGALVKIAAGTAMPALTGVSIAAGAKGIVGFACDANGTLTALAGPSATAVGSLAFPAIPDNTVAIGYLVIENGSGSTFTGGTTALDAASITVTYINQYDGFQPLTIL